MDHGSECHLVPSACKPAISALIRAHESVLYLHLFLVNIMLHLLQVLGRMPMSVPLNSNMLCNYLTGASLLHRFFLAHCSIAGDYTASAFFPPPVKSYLKLLKV